MFTWCTKTSLSCSQFIFKLKALVLFALLSNKPKKCFYKYNNHKTIEILCSECKNLKTNTPFPGYEDFVIFVHNSDLCCGSYKQVLKQALRYLCQPFFFSYSFVYMTEPFFLPFLNASSVQKWNKTKIYKSEYRTGNIMQWFCRAIKLCIIWVKIYAAIMMKVAFEIKSNI